MDTEVKTLYDSEVDVLYIVSKEGELSRSEEVWPGITMEYDEKGGLLGIEILRATQVFTKRVVDSLQEKLAVQA